VLLVVRWRRCSFERGFVFSHAAVRDREARFAPMLTAHLRTKRRGATGTRWHADETYRKIDGRWCSLYRASDREGNLVDAPLSERRAMAAAQQCCTRARAAAGQAPAQMTTDGHDASPRAIRETRSGDVAHRTSRQ